ncbi:MAG: hypothetical protein LPK38_00955, partial [Actinomycetes bacterium]|nr:hypothetical protein [Actinomycetes bacterium]MDX5379884.1 hypothetical protein [Actinomycetes bacterium]MDX5398360.1 hypothetical protein [Actinomycetes bacterium]MDX5449588.1 hypothetical protein [Actinomycetes bacterium]
MANRRRTDPNERHLQVVGGTEHTPHTGAPERSARHEQPEDAADETYTAEDAAELEALLEPMLGLFA